MLEGDTPVAAAQQANSWQDARIEHWWDGTKRVSQAVQQAVGLQGPAWDLYLLYGPAAQWHDEAPPLPAFWMHQLADSGADPSFLLCRDPDWLGLELDILKQE
jgi:hypothetical protein